VISVLWRQEIRRGKLGSPRPYLTHRILTNASAVVAGWDKRYQVKLVVVRGAYEEHSVKLAE
jgi:hypothetical protein